MALIFLYFLAGLALLLFGADRLTDGAVGLARRCRLSEMVTGLTVVALGTSLPELASCFTAVWRGHEGLAAGNLVGSNIFNVLAVVGCSALVRPISVSRSTVVKDIPFALWATLALIVASSDVVLDGALGGNFLSRTDGLIFLGCFVVFMAYTFGRADRRGGPAEEARQQQPPAVSRTRVVCSLLLGVVGLAVGAVFFVEAAAMLATGWGISESRMGLTLMAVGTSLPELVTSIVAARKGSSAIAIGNVVGSNVFNVFLVAGCCATVLPMDMGGIGLFDWAVMLSGLLLLWYFSYTRHVVERWEGGLLVALYGVYLARWIGQAWI